MFNWEALMGALGKGAENAGFKNPETGEWNTDRIGMTLGQLGAALAPKDSWQERFNNAVSGIGTSNIYAKAQAKSNQEKQAYMQSLIKALGGLTPDGAAGPTTYSENADGSFNIKGNVPGVNAGTKVGGVGKEDLSLTTPGPTIGNMPESITPRTSGIAYDPWAKFMGAVSGFQNSSAGLTSADFAGLSPKEIDALAGRELQGNEQGLRTLAFLNDIFGPREGQVVEGPQNYMVIDRITGQPRDTGIPVYRAQEYKAPTTMETSGGIMQWDPTTNSWKPTGMNPYVKPSTERARQYQVQYYSPTTGQQGSTLVDEYSYNTKVAELQKQGYIVGNAPSPRPPGEITEIDAARMKSRAIAFNDQAKEGDRIRAVSEYNATSPDNSTTFLVFKAPYFGSNKAVEKKLPAGKTMGDIRKLTNQYGVSLDGYLKHLAEK